MMSIMRSEERSEESEEQSHAYDYDG